VDEPLFALEEHPVGLRHLHDVAEGVTAFIQAQLVGEMIDRATHLCLRIAFKKGRCGFHDDLLNVRVVGDDGPFPKGIGQSLHFALRQLIIGSIREGNVDEGEIVRRGPGLRRVHSWCVWPGREQRGLQ